MSEYSFWNSIFEFLQGFKKFFWGSDEQYWDFRIGFGMLLWLSTPFIGIGMLVLLTPLVSLFSLVPTLIVVGLIGFYGESFIDADLVGRRRKNYRGEK